MKRFITTVTLLITLVGLAFATPKIKSCNAYNDGSFVIEYEVSNEVYSVSNTSVNEQLNSLASDGIVPKFVSIENVSEDLAKLIYEYGSVMTYNWNAEKNCLDFVMIYNTSKSYMAAIWER